MADVFISFSFKDQILVEKIVDQLKNKYHIGCWICTAEVHGGDAFYDEIMKAIINSKILVFIQTENSVTSKEIFDEIINAIDQDKIVIRFIIDNSELYDGMRLKLYGRQYVDARKPEFDERVEDLAREIAIRLHASAQTNTKHDITSSALEGGLLFDAFRMLKSHYPRLIKDPIGRSDEMGKMDQFLLDTGVVSLYGMGGEGKTLTAQKYIKTRNANFDTIIMACYETSLADVFLNEMYFPIPGITRDKNESNLDYAKRKLKEIKRFSNEKTLIVIDNFDVAEDELLEDFLDGPYKIIFTTRIYLDFLPVITINALKEEEQKLLFWKNYKPQDTNWHATEEDEKSVGEIIAMLNGHALAIELVAKFMRSRFIKPSLMKKELEEKGFLEATHGKTLSCSISQNSAYKNIERLFHMETLSDNEITILKNLSLLPLKGMKIYDFIECSGLEDGEIIGQLCEKSWVKYADDTGRISLHPLISEVVRNFDGKDYNKSSLFINNLSKRFWFGWSVDKETKIENCELAKSFFEKMPGEYIKNINIQRSLLYAFQISDCVSMLEKIVDLMLDIWKEETIELAWIYYSIGDVLLQYQHYDKALSYTQKSIDVLNLLGIYSYDKAYLYRQKARVLNCLYKQTQNIEDLDLGLEALKSSEAMFQEACKSPETQYGSECYNFGIDKSKDNISCQGIIYYTYSLNYYYRGDYLVAIEYGTKSYDLLVSINGEVNSDTTAPMRVLAMAYSKLGRFDEAIEMQKKVIAAREQLWGADQFRYFEQLEALADIYIESGRIESGVEELNKLLSLLEKTECYSLYKSRIINRIKEYLNF